MGAIEMLRASFSYRSIVERRLLITFLITFAFFATFGWGSLAQGKTIKIVALGASNTIGAGANHPWPAQLQKMLRKKGYKVKILNKGIFGDTTRNMLRRLHSAVPVGTSLVILQPGVINDVRAGIYGKERYYISQIRRRLGAEHIKFILLLHLKRIAGSDTFVDRAHFSNKGHAQVAAYLLPRVITALQTTRH